jgi:gamma-glutamyltranspeptidase
MDTQREITIGSGDRPAGWIQQTRSVVMATNGIVATSQPLAAQAGLRILMQGGNAVDAAVATAVTLNVAEPMSTGIGGDMFAIVYLAMTGEPLGLNGSGRSPTGATGSSQRGGVTAVSTRSCAIPPVGPILPARILVNMGWPSRTEG